ncbi:FMN-binding protein MioC [Sodalis endosymbiont of Henestaris halophilus]|uniref:FMN-binding protein MioC n=1 Tax=Sodalis endosymbiont of Henestaris halophilus TaxID=1929246 RepID=UPI000BBF5314|nr:FMN-binding protein MioC [Sodalis endosymbiont of Henestaris halophilus]SNC58484.1 Sulfite reductase [NADPH] flavoprotein alpha-component [Sodalis endosymbiont of Henestaris halophilus]
MADITIISGSTLGSAEYIAEHVAVVLEQQGFAIQILHGAKLTELSAKGLWLLVTSTHGSGQLPENLHPLLYALTAEEPSLSEVTFGAIGIGSSEYDTFCNAIDILNQKLIALGAKRIGEVLKIDIAQQKIPEDLAEIWITEWIAQIKTR